MWFLSVCAMNEETYFSWALRLFVILHFWKAVVEVSSFWTFQASDIKMAEIKLKLDLLCCALCHFHLATSLSSFLLTIFCFKVLEHVLFQWISIGVLLSVFWYRDHIRPFLQGPVLEASQKQIENAIQSISAHGFLSDYGASS